VIPGLLASLAMLCAIRRGPAQEKGERQPIRVKVRPVLQAGLGRLFGGMAAFEIANISTTLLILRTTELLEPGRSSARNRARHRLLCALQPGGHSHQRPSRACR
jgi:hypothetical protein